MIPKINNLGRLVTEDLPYNCIFNKIVTGCGGTTIALFNEEQYVIAVPYTELIINKTKSKIPGTSIINHPDTYKEQQVFGWFGENTEDVERELLDYIHLNGVKKIMCTYDKLPYLNRYINTLEYRLLIDEYQVLFKDYSYRENTIENVFNNFKRYKSYCFMSATPIENEFVPDALEGIPTITATIDDGAVEKLKVELIETNKPYVKVANIINAYKQDGVFRYTINNELIESKNLFFFINSVTDISNILKHCNLSAEETRIICANDERNRKTLLKIPIQTSKDPVKPFNFITRKGFEGVDFYSETGLCIVVSSKHSKFTMLDIGTDIFQIAGRVRDSKFSKYILHIYSTAQNGKLDFSKSYEDKKQEVFLKEETDKQLVQTMNEQNTKGYLIEHLIEERLILLNANNTLKLNDMIGKLLLFNYRIQQLIYNDGISITTAYKNNNAEPTITETQYNIKKPTFKECFISYSETKNPHMLKLFPIIEGAYNKLGADKVRSLKYIQKDVYNALLSLNADNHTQKKIALKLDEVLKRQFYPSKYLKNVLTDAYNDLQINKKAKASDIEQFYDCNLTNKKIDGKTVRGYELKNLKYVVLN